jgi:hypothetical protein
LKAMRTESMACCSEPLAKCPLGLHAPTGCHSPIAAAGQVPTSSQHPRGLELAGCYRSEGAHSEA